MKKLWLIFVAAIMIVASALVVFAGDYTIYEHDWNSDYNKGTVRIEWSKCEESTKYKVVVHHKALDSSRAAAGKVVLQKTVSGNKLDITDLIYAKGKGLYTYAITPVKSPHALDDMVVSDSEFEADTEFVNRVRARYDDPSYYNTGWVRTPNGWSYQEMGITVTSAWRQIGGYWYYFNHNGDMLTGWQHIGSRWYYLTPVQGQGGYPMGACWMSRTTPDGYTVNASGEWVINGVPQN